MTVRVNLLGLLFRDFLYVTAKSERGSVRIHAQQLFSDGPDHQTLHVCIRYLWIALHKRYALVHVLDPFSHHGRDLFQIQLEVLHQAEVVTALLRSGNILAPGVLRDHVAHFFRVRQRLHNRRHSFQTADLRRFQATMTKNDALALPEITQFQRALYPIASHVLAQLRELGVIKLLAHGNQRRVDLGYRHLEHFTHASGPRGRAILGEFWASWRMSFVVRERRIRESA